MESSQLLHKWGEIFHDKIPLTHDKISRCIFYNFLYQQIDSKSKSLDKTFENPDNVKEVVHNWKHLLVTVKEFYDKELQCVLVHPSCNYVKILLSSDVVEYLPELRNLYTFLIGVAAQSEYKIKFVEELQANFEEDELQVFVDLLQKVMVDGDYVLPKTVSEEYFNPENAEMLKSFVTRLVSDMHSLVEQRDSKLDELADLFIQLDSSRNQIKLLELRLAQQDRSPLSKDMPFIIGNNTDTHHNFVEISDLKSQLRKLRDDYDEKSYMFTEVSEEVKELRVKVKDLKDENDRFRGEASLSRQLKDEIDVLKDKAVKCSRLETEISRFKEKLTQLDYYKTRAEELRNENNVLHQEKAILESELENKDNSERIAFLTAEIRQLKLDKVGIESSLEDARLKIIDLTEENVFLQNESKESFNESQSLEQELERTKTLQEGKLIGETLSDSFNSDAQHRLLEVEAKNRALRKQVADLMTSKIQTQEFQDRIKQLEKENTMIKSEKYGKNQRDIEEINNVVTENKKLESEITNLKTQLEDLEINDQKLKDENIDLKRVNAEVDNLKRKCKDLSLEKSSFERESKKLKLKVGELESMKSEVSVLKDENQFLKSVEEEKQALAQDYKDLEKECRELLNNLNIERKTVSSLRSELVEEKIKVQNMMNEKRQSVCLEQSTIDIKVSSLQSQNQLLQEELHSYKDKYQSQVNSKRQSLERNSSAVKEFLDIKDHLVDVERRNASLEKEKESFISTVNNWKEKVDSSESALSSLQSEYNLVQSELATCKVELSTSRSEKEGLHQSNKKLQSANSELNSRVSSAERDLAKLSADHVHMQQLHDNLTQEYDTLRTEYMKLKDQLKLLKQQLKVRDEELNVMIKERDSIKHLQEALERETSALADDSRNFVRMQADYDNLQSEYRRLIASKDKCDQDLRHVSTEMQSVKRNLSDKESDLTRAENDLLNLREQLCNFEKQNDSLSSEKTNLMTELRTLLSQNQELLTHALGSKDDYRVEERQLRERLAHLQRNKERLEDKIMEQYKTSMTSPKKSKQSKLNQVKLRAKDLLSPRSRADSLASVDSLSPESLQDFNHNGNHLSSSKSSIISGKLIPRHSSIYDMNLDERGPHEIGLREFLNELNTTPTNKVVPPKTLNVTTNNNNDDSGGFATPRNPSRPSSALGSPTRRQLPPTPPPSRRRAMTSTPIPTTEVQQMPSPLTPLSGRRLPVTERHEKNEIFHQKSSSFESNSSGTNSSTNPRPPPRRESAGLPAQKPYTAAPLYAVPHRSTTPMPNQANRAPVQPARSMTPGPQIIGSIAPGSLRRGQPVVPRRQGSNASDQDGPALPPRNQSQAPTAADKSNHGPYIRG